MEMEDLQWLDETIRRDFPQLECKMFDNDKFVRVAKTVGSTGLKFMPDFYLIFNSVNNGSFCLRLLTYNGRTLDTVMFRCDHDQEQLPEKVNNQLVRMNQMMKLCQGTPKDTLTGQDCLIDYLNDAITARSFKCKFILSEVSTTEILCCDECQKLIAMKKEVEVIRNNEDCSDLFPEIKANIKKEENLNASLLLIESMKVEGEDDDYDYYADRSSEPNWEDTLPNLDSITVYKGEPRRPKKVKNYNDDWEIDLFKETPDNFGELYNNRKKRGRPRKLNEGTRGPKGPKKPRGRPRLILPPSENMEDGGKDDQSEVKQPSYDENDAICCKICLQSYKTESAIGQHFRKHLKHFDIKGDVECPMCNVTIKKLDLTEHFDQVHSTKEEPLTCCIGCQKVMKHKNGDSLQMHIIKEHQSTNNMCETCGKVFAYQKSLDCHRQTQHSDLKEYFCDRCGKGFGHELALQKHVYVACAMEEWKCEICAKVFGCRKKLRMHLMVHCEEKPYACKHCAYRSYKADNLALHVKKTHHMSGVRADFVTIDEVLASQTVFVERYLKNARLK